MADDLDPAAVERAVDAVRAQWNPQSDEERDYLDDVVRFALTAARAGEAATTEGS